MSPVHPPPVHGVPPEGTAVPRNGSASDLLLRLAHSSLSAALRHDYFSTGQGHQQSKAVIGSRALRPARRLSSAPDPAPADDAQQAHASDAAHPAESNDAADAPQTFGEPNSGDAPWEQALAGTDADGAGADIAARYLADVAQCRRLNSSEEYHLASRASEGDLPSRQRLIEHHLGLVVMMARRYVNKGLPLLDLIEEGNLGLITAAGKFDPELGYRFSTYAKWWVRQSIEMALMKQSRLVRLPIHLSRSAKQAARQQKQASGLNAEGTPLEAAPLGADLVALLDQDDRDGGQLIDELPADETTSPEAHVSHGERRTQLRRVLAELSDKERRVVESRYGLMRPDPRTLDDIARELGLSCERVRQIENEALRKLRGFFADHGIESDSLY